MYTFISMYIYIYIERERGRDIDISIHKYIIRIGQPQAPEEGRRDPAPRERPAVRRRRRVLSL